MGVFIWQAAMTEAGHVRVLARSCRPLFRTRLDWHARSREVAQARLHPQSCQNGIGPTTIGSGQNLEPWAMGLLYIYKCAIKLYFDHVIKVCLSRFFLIPLSQYVESLQKFMVQTQTTIICQTISQET